MKQVTYILLSVLLIFNIACTSSDTSQKEEAQKMDETTQEMASEKESMSSDDAFTVTVLNDSLPSPRKEMTATVGGAKVVINYGSPSVKGRTVWGDLVPFGDIWRTGANEATTIEFDKNVKIAGQELTAGKYALFSIPFEENWTLIFNKEVEQWGAYKYNEEEDALRVMVTPEASEKMSETMEFKANGEQVMMIWEKMVVPFSIESV